MMLGLLRWEAARLSRPGMLLLALLAAFAASFMSGFGLEGLVAFAAAFFFAHTGADQERELHYFSTRGARPEALILSRALAVSGMLALVWMLSVPAAWLSYQAVYSVPLLVWLHLIVPSVFDFAGGLGDGFKQLLLAGLLGSSQALLNLAAPLFPLRWGLANLFWLPTAAYAVGLFIAPFRSWEKMWYSWAAISVLACINLAMALARSASRRPFFRSKHEIS